MTDAMAGGSPGAGGSLAGIRGQGLQPTLLLPCILWQKDTNPLWGPISRGSTSPKGSHASAGRRGWDVRHPCFGEEEICRGSVTSTRSHGLTGSRQLPSDVREPSAAASRPSQAWCSQRAGPGSAGAGEHRHACQDDTRRPGHGRCPSGWGAQTQPARQEGGTDTASRLQVRLSAGVVHLPS